MKEIFLLDDAIISPLGFTTSENLKALRNNESGLKFQKNSRFPSGGFYSGLIDDFKLKQAFSAIGDPGLFTKLEQMMILAVHQVLVNNKPLDFSNTGLIISTTKGNIDLIGETGDIPEDRIYLSKLSEKVAEFFGFKEPILISNACISGGLALVAAKRFINSGRFSQAIVVGGDIVSEFVVSGFQSFMALSDSKCKPFSVHRNGINLGEAAAAILVGSNHANKDQHISLIGQGSVNDANHISGPSRTGEGLYRSIGLALKSAGISSRDIGYISAHGTGTLYNDEMEAIAFHRAGLTHVPVNSYKAYYGHTLGAAALLESILSCHSLLNNEVFKSLNYDESGVSHKLNIIEEHRRIELKYVMKTASGFGGCNIAMIFKKSGNGI